MSDYATSLLREQKIYAHFIDTEHGIITKCLLPGVPCVGDEIRVTGSLYYAVTDIVWCLDEKHETGAFRINVGMKKIDLEKDGAENE